MKHAAIPAHPALDISYQSQNHTLVVRWRGYPLSDADYKASYRCVLDMAVQHNCRFWLLDIRRCLDSCPLQANWLSQEFCQEVLAAFQASEQVYAAYLLFPAHMPYYSETVLPLLTHPSNTGYRVATFIDESLSNAWIRSQQ